MLKSVAVFNCWNSGVRASITACGLITQRNMCEQLQTETVKSSSALFPLVSASRKDGLNFTRYSPHTRSFSSKSSSDSIFTEEQNSHLNNDPEIRAWMNQISQDFEKGQEPFLTNTCEELHEGRKVEGLPTNVHTRNISVNSTELQDTAEVEIEEFGYLEDDEDDFDNRVPERHVPISLNRGHKGVFDVEEIVSVLEHENGIDVQVINIPPEVRFVDHMVVVSGKSLRHMRAMAASIEWMFKQKRERGDRQFKLEGRDCKDWLAVDLGNIAVHIFTPEARQHYDLETLWTLGPDHDDRRHYVEDDHLNLSAADLFWLETGVKEFPKSQATQEDKTVASPSDMSVDNGAGKIRQ